jgi:hypothetical protein
VLVPALLGAALLLPLGLRLRIDVIGDEPARWPGPGASLGYAALFVLAVGLSTIGWRRAMTWERARAEVMGWGLLVHLVAILSPPFLSLDANGYAAIGRAVAYGGSPLRPLSETLPVSDPVAQLLPRAWRTGTFPYGPVFKQVAHLVARIAGDDLALALRLFQGLALLCVFAAAFIIGRAAEGEARTRHAGDPARAGTRAIALVLFCPVTILEATVNAHNDAWLMIPVALFVAAAARGRSGLLQLLSGLVVKSSTVILAAIDLLRLGIVRLGRALSARQILGGGAVAIGALLALVFAFDAARSAPALDGLVQLLGDPNEAVPHCTRSIECLPRAFFGYVVPHPTLGFAIGLMFRVLAALWLLYAAVRSARDGRILAWAATGLFGYYLCLHAYMESWYLLQLVPLVAFADATLVSAMTLFLTTAAGYYAIQIAMNTVSSHTLIGVREFLEAAVVVLPTLGVVLRRRLGVRLTPASVPAAGQLDSSPMG